MKRIADLLTSELELAFEKAGYDKQYAKVTLSNRPDLCEYQCNGAMAAAKTYRKAPIMIANDVVAVLNESSCVEKVDAVAPGFINIILDAEFVASYLKDMDKEEMRELGKAFRYHEYYHKGVNVNFYDIIGEEEIVELTYERGVEDFTLACGTGTGSMVSTLYKLGLSTGQNVKVHVPGGLLKIDLNVEDGEIKDIFLTGPTNIVVEGELTDEELEI